MKAPSGSHVAVVGAGVVGLCCALELLRAGFRVTVLERGDGEDSASHGNAGMLVPSHAIPLAAPGVIAQGLPWLFRRDSPLYIRPRPDRDLLRWLWLFRRACTDAHVERAAPLLRDMALEGIDWFDALHRASPTFDLERRGLLMVHDSDDGRRHDLAVAETVRGLGLHADVLDGAQLRRLEPGLRSPARGAVVYREDGHLHPGKLMAALATAVVAGGGLVRRDAAVGSLMPGMGGVALDLGGDALAVDRVVVTAGAFSAALTRQAGARIPVQPAKGYSVTLPRGGVALQHPIILSEAKVTVTPMGADLRFAGTLELGGFDRSVDGRRVRPILEEARRYLPELDIAGIVAGDVEPRVWAGFRPCTPDGMPLVGGLPALPGTVVATGHGMLGITLAPATARLVTELLTDGAPPAEPLRANRFGS